MFLDAHVFSEVEPCYERFVLCFIVGGLKAAAYGLLDEIPFW